MRFSPISIKSILIPTISLLTAQIQNLVYSLSYSTITSKSHGLNDDTRRTLCRLQTVNRRLAGLSDNDSKRSSAITTGKNAKQRAVMLLLANTPGFVEDLEREFLGADSESV